MTIKTKIVLAYTIVFGVMLSGFAFLVYRSSRDAEISKLDAHLESQAEKLQAEIEEQYAERQFPVIADILSITTDGLQGLHFRLVDAKNQSIIADTDFPTLSAAIVQELLREPRLLSTVELRHTNYRLLTSPVEVNDRNIYLLQLAAPLSIVDANVQHLQLLFLFSIPVVLLLTSLGAYLITRTAFRPLTSMVEISRNISADNLEARLALPKVNDEVHLLGETLNSMMDRIQSAFKSQRQFVADASHEFRTPLTVMYSELEFAQQRVNDEAVKESIRIALAEIDRLAKMTEGMLTLSKLDASDLPLNVTVVRLDELLVECVQLMKGLAAQKQIGLHLHIDEAIEMNADREKIRSAVLNLLDNAVKYSSPGGSVSIALLTDGRLSKSVSIKIEDTGSGISGADLPNVFKRFFRGASQRAGSPGNGLGLAIVEQIVKLHSGKVAVQSVVNQGTTLILDFPITKC